MTETFNFTSINLISDKYDGTITGGSPKYIIVPQVLLLNVFVSGMGVLQMFKFF